MSFDAPLHAALAPLLEIVEARPASRLVARPDEVVVDDAAGSTAVALGWDETRHAAALAALGADAARAGSGVAAFAVGGAVVLVAPPRADQRVDELTRAGLISALAGRTLSAAVGLGRNVLVAGPWSSAVPVIAAIVAEGRRPALVGGATDALPRGFSLVAHAREAALRGADRIAAWSLSPRDLAPLMCERSGVVGWVDARRLDRALMRLELGFGDAAPLSMLAALDLAVVVSDQPGVQVVEVAELTLADEGYRPRLLFSTGFPPVPASLVPVQAPSFLAELARAGFGVLADELRHAAPAPRRAEPSAAPPIEPTRRRSDELSPRAASRAPSPTPAAVSEDSPPPGWEIDRMGAVEAADGGANQSAEDANLAATFGLGPPPRPATLRQGEAGRSFDEALQRARARAESGEPGDD